ncbi:MAG: tRNA pseudouridine(54/55) synthase Pus10 [Methanomassiliicoccus sp.]|nr:tRNA pseudouridine(54/55) synthase Pus10 [Methanomassiliicoccus sp.]
MNETIERADRALKAHDLCDHCLGRLFAQVESGTTNAERGRNMRVAVTAERSARNEEMPSHDLCWLCEGAFDSVERFAEAAIERLSTIEYNSFLIGTRVDPLVQDREERLWAEVGGDKAEPVKAELNREIGKIVEARTGKQVEFRSPDVVAVVDTRFAQVDLDIAPIFFYGRYRKYSREIPQTKWPCRVCQGKGCKRCGNTGKMYQISVQEVIGDVFLEEAGGEEHFFHGMGREDIDARMLGTGRPFVLEISKPKRRHLDLEALTALVNEKGKDLADFSGLRPSTREEVRQIKAATPDKVYLAVVRPHDKVNKGQVDEVTQSLSQARITQQTPTRVAHRRADLARQRAIHELQLMEFNDDRFVLRLRTESGTYVKEFVSGDNGRTVPSFSAALGVPCEVTALDVIQIIDNSNEG